MASARPDRRPRAVAFAPGRVNLIGEHTDYEEGLALPFAIAEGVTVTATALAGEEVHAVARDLGEEDRFPLAAPAPATGWRAFVRGTVAELRAAGHAVPAARIELTGTVPRGGGLSSSAALGVALALALLDLAGAPSPDAVALARLCSRVENAHVGARTGLLDQLASLLGRADEAVLLDLRTCAARPVPLALGAWRLVVLPSGEAHEHAAGGYAQRRAECREAARLLGVRALRDATVRDVAALPGPLAERARHVVEENARIEAAVAALEAGDLAALGRLLDASHASLRDLFAASTPAVEAAVSRLRAAGAAGARMVGGGFGGHVLALLPPGTPVPAGARGVAPCAGALARRAAPDRG